MPISRAGQPARRQRHVASPAAHPGLTVRVAVEIQRVDRVTGLPVGRARHLPTAHSWVKQWADGLASMLSEVNLASLDVLGISRTPAIGSNSGYLRIIESSIAGMGSYGVVVGVGTTAPTRDDTALETRIFHGTGSGQLTHQGSDVAAVATIGSTTYRITASRQFDNDSGASITIQEVGLYAISTRTVSGFDVYLLLHDLVSGGYAVPNGQAALVRYLIDFIV